MNGEVTYVIIDLWSRVGELDELSWGWAHAQLTGVFWQRNLSALVHHQVGSSRFNTSSSSGYIQQLFREVDYSSSQRVSPSHHVTMIRDKAIRFPTYRVQNFRMLLPSSSEGYYNPSAHHPGFQQQLIYYFGAYTVWEEGAVTHGRRFGVSLYSSAESLHAGTGLFTISWSIYWYVHALISPI